jgi:hypothetical protein
MDKAADYGAANGRSKVVTFQVTGWSDRPFWQSPKTLAIGGVEALAFALPYSDHSGRGELLEFVEAIGHEGHHILTYSFMRLFFAMVVVRFSENWMPTERQRCLHA